MNVWLVLLLGILIGWIIGIFLVRQNYETCKKQVELLKKELSESGAELEAASKTLEKLTHEVEETAQG